MTHVRFRGTLLTVARLVPSADVHFLSHICMFGRAFLPLALLSKEFLNTIHGYHGVRLSGPSNRGIPVPAVVCCECAHARAAGVVGSWRRCIRHPRGRSQKICDLFGVYERRGHGWRCWIVSLTWSHLHLMWQTQVWTFGQWRVLRLRSCVGTSGLRSYGAHVWATGNTPSEPSASKDRGHESAISSA